MKQEMRIREQKITRVKTSELNQTAAKGLIVLSVLCLAIDILFKAQILESKGLLVRETFIILPLTFFLSGIICLFKKGYGEAFQYVFSVLLIAFWLCLEMMSGYKSKLLLPIIIIISMQYYNKRLTLFVYSISVIALAAAVFLNAYFYKVTGFLDLNLVYLDGPVKAVLNGNLTDEIILLQPSPKVLLFYGIMLAFLPNFLFLTVITFFATRFMRKNLYLIQLAERLAEKESKEQLELADLKTKVMLSQVKPHFVYNALSSIAQLCEEDPQKAKRLTVDFSNYLRNHLDVLNEGTPAACMFSTELKHIQSYLNIEQARFEDILRVEYDIDGTDFFVPALSIQPIVENAVKHGVCKKADGGTVKISAKKNEDGWVVTVSDDGIGFDKSKINSDGKTHIGIENMEKRIKLFGGSFDIESTPGKGTVARIFVPEREK